MCALYTLHFTLFARAAVSKPGQVLYTLHFTFYTLHFSNRAHWQTSKARFTLYTLHFARTGIRPRALHFTLKCDSTLRFLLLCISLHFTLYAFHPAPRVNLLSQHSNASRRWRSGTMPPRTWPLARAPGGWGGHSFSPPRSVAYARSGGTVGSSRLFG